VNILQDSVLTSQQIGGISPSEAFILNNNNRSNYSIKHNVL